MGAIDFIWNVSQSGQIGTIGEKIEALEKDMETARAWIEYLNKRIEDLEQQNANIGCKQVNQPNGEKQNE